MRYFNTSGPCDPAEHYTVMRPALIVKGREKVRRGRYFTLFAPRQAGKTTYFQLLMRELGDEYTPIWVSFENLKTVSKEVFYQDFDHQIKQELSAYQITADDAVNNPSSLAVFFEKIPCRKPVVLFIDEFEGIPDSVLSELMHTFRKMYHRKDYHVLHSVVLVGVSTIAELVVSSASPFNIVDELKISYFTDEEIREMIGQYVAESGQEFTKDVIRAIYENTKGQPGLVCGLCQYLTEEVATDISKPVTMEHFYRTLTHFLTERYDKNIINIVQKAKEKKSFMIRLLFDEKPVPFSVDDPDMSYLSAHGVIENVNGVADIPVPMYVKRLITAFRPLFNGEGGHYAADIRETFGEYLTQDGLNISALLNRYSEYVRRRGFKAFDTEHLKEAAWHYSLDGFITFFIGCLGGQTFIEVPSGRGRTDILILYGNNKYIIETKIFSSSLYFEKGKKQLAQYLESERISEGYYVVFSNKHTEADMLYSEEEINGKRIFTYVIRTCFERPSE
ncbi:MAG TPA: hypothetical protein DCQ37_09390 [Desulfobacteraceae bacterium]|nr:hypothetical protein [Desulfobacteraceae bacterium]